jgi:cyclophilin family peptidyl-prolyl cis-trans isomerase
MKIKILVFFLCLSILSGFAQQKNKPVFVKIYTTAGNIKVVLYDDTPQHKYNFLQLVEKKTYEGLLFHRVIKDFMIQGGDPESIDADSTKVLGNGSMGYTLPAEIKFPEHYHKRGVLAAARKSDNVNPTKESSACQFYIVTGSIITDEELDFYEKNINKLLTPKEPLKYTEEQRRQYKTFGGAPHLDGNYTIFGEVVEGFDVLDKIQNIPTDKNNRPKQDIKILKMKAVKK